MQAPSLQPHSILEAADGTARYLEQGVANRVVMVRYREPIEVDHAPKIGPRLLVHLQERASWRLLRVPGGIAGDEDPLPPPRGAADGGNVQERRRRPVERSAAFEITLPATMELEHCPGFICHAVGELVLVVLDVVGTKPDIAVA